MNLPQGFMLACVGEREDPRDAFVSNNFANLAALPAGAVIGTSSLRRESQLRARFPHLKIEPLRGNVQTRLRKLDEGKYAAIILAAAGLKRLGLGDRIRDIISSEDSLPAVGTGRTRHRMPRRPHRPQSRSRPVAPCRYRCLRAGGACHEPGIIR